MNKELLHKNLADAIAKIDEHLNSFITSLKPSTMWHELTWADDAFVYAARRKVFAYVVKTLEGAQQDRDYNFDAMAWIMKNVVQSAGDRSKSTSDCANLLSRCVTEAWALVVEIAERCP